MRLLLSLLLSFGLAGTAMAAGHAPKGLVILTVGGDLPDPNAPGADPDEKSLFGYLDIGFPNAYAFDQNSLAALGVHQVRANVLDLGEKTYSGPRLTDVMTAAGAPAKSAFPTALDGYQPEIAWDQMVQYAPIVATHADGVPLAIGRLGPTMIVYPVVEDAEVYDSFRAFQVYGLFLIKVE